MKQGWEINKLGEVCKNVSNINWKKISIDTEYPYIDLSAVDRDSSNICDYEYVNKDNAPSRAKQVVNTGDVIFATTRPLLKRVCVITELFNNAIASTGFCVLRPTEKVISKWIYYKLKSDSFYKYIEPLQKGISYPAISDNEVKNFILPIPPREEQERIVAELDCLNGVIEKKKQQLKELDALAQSIFYQMFGDPITNEKGWEVKNLGEVCDVRDGTHDSPKYLECSDYILITSKNITNDSNIDFSTANYISKEDYESINKRSYVESGDIIMAMIGTIGKPIIVKETDKKFCIKNVALIKFGCSTMVINTYIKAMLNNPDYGQYIQSQNKGGTQKFVALGTIRNLPIPLPSIEIQQQFADKIEAIEKQKELIKQSIKETETLFNARMDYYFN
jgi:type I restriction enzyme S subunit